MRPWYFQLLLTLFCASGVMAANSPAHGDDIPASGNIQPEWKRLEAAVKQFMAERNIPAAALCVSQGGVLLAERGYGWKRRERSEPLPPDALFRIASITKPYTAAAIRKLARQGKLQYAQYVFDLGQTPPGLLKFELALGPESPEIDSRLKQITVQHLLDHKGGWDRDLSGDPMFRAPRIARTLGVRCPPSQEEIARYMMGRRLDHDPGEKYAYSNFGYLLLGLIIEKITGLDYVEYLRREILAPAGVPESELELGRTLPERRNSREPFYQGGEDKGRSLFETNSLVPYPDGVWDLESMEAHGGLITSARACAQFLEAYWINGEPRQGEKYNYTFFGSLDGTFTMARQRRDGVNVVVFFNQRSDPSGLPYDSIRQLVDSAVDEIQSGGGEFARIEAILQKHCHSCHGAEKQKAGLRLDQKARALEGGDSGKVIVPGDSANSLLYKLVAGLNPDEVMPPKGERLSAEEIAIIKNWIDAGAAWPETSAKDAAASATAPNAHWAFRPVQRSPVPEVKGASWIRNPIDAFILARLEKEGLDPSPEAERETLLRRLSLDLTGLPPTPEELESYLADAAPGAYERQVERLLQSPHYGERWGRHWLDLARYAESDGYEKDGIRPYAYLYRDWVIKALNADMPFDWFSIEQLAGDLLPKAALEQKIATGFHRNTLKNLEGGVDQEEFRCKAVVDRVSTTATVWLGLTLGCAECHTHKYDPITQREFYQFYAFFNNASEEDISAPHAEELREFEERKLAWDIEQKRLETALAEYLAAAPAARFAEWEKSMATRAVVWTALAVQSAVSSNGATLKIHSDRSVEASGSSPPVDTYTIELSPPSTPLSGLRLEIFADAKKGPGRRGNKNFVLSEFICEIVDETGARPLPFKSAIADHAPSDWPVAGTIDGNIKTGWAIDPQFTEPHQAIFECAGPSARMTNAKLRIRLEQQNGDEHTIRHFRVSAAERPGPFQVDITPDAILAIVVRPVEERTERECRTVEEYYWEQVDDGAVKIRKQITAHKKKVPKFPETKAQAFKENATTRSTHIHVRGDFLRKGDSVMPGVLAVLHPLKPPPENAGHEQTPNRLDLARWLFDPANPLTSRVAVNRIWAYLFGRGLVRTLDDFGARGEAPSHPELLDWLSSEMMARNWRQKEMIKLIVTSAAYRQSSTLRPELEKRDPFNTLLARQNRLRLEAEIVRDCALRASGLLNAAIGGPSIRPPLPADIAALGYANSVKWAESSGAAKHRRGMYIFFQRTVPYPMLVTFDAPDSNSACTRRERSNTPLQALTLLNDPVFVECAQALGLQLSRKETGHQPEELIRQIFQACLGRRPSTPEMERLKTLHEMQLEHFSHKPEQAAKVVGQSNAGEPNVTRAAAAVALARTVLNLDEFIMRE